MRIEFEERTLFWRVVFILWVVMALVALALLIPCVGCTGPTSASLPGEYAQVITLEWQQMLRSVDSLTGAHTKKIRPEHFTWVPRDGYFPCNDCCEGCYCAGRYNPDKERIDFVWSALHVLRHEAAHAYFHKLGHRCWRCISVDGPLGEPAVVSVHSGCDDLACIEWIERRLEE